MDIIQLLPDNIANQIAAGEVIQRPASALKELLENAIDAGSTSIKVSIAEAGKNMLQVADNGKGMSETDVRMAFERHATSKIQKIDDLFHIRTMGFRGEALASIAAVAQVEIKTKKKEDEHGTYLAIENSQVQTQEPCACTDGTVITMKNLFFSVPARRNFLKSNAAELKHIVEEFTRVAMPYPDVFFSLEHNGQEMFHLDKGSLKQRLVQLLGNNVNQHLVQVKEETDYMNIYGFIGKPEASRKTRGDQYFFVNNRFIKSAYLNHAVINAFSELLPKDNFPLYVLFIELDPAQIDINVHPTKQEIKFEDEKLVYAFVQAAVKHAIAQASIAPSLDFTLDAEIQQMDAVSKPITSREIETAASSNLFKTFTQKNQAHFIDPSLRSEIGHWKDFYDPSSKKNESDYDPDAPAEASASDKSLFSTAESAGVQISDSPDLQQILNTYIVAPVQNGYVLIHQQLAHERILFERYTRIVEQQRSTTQQLLIPTTIELSVADSILLEDLMPELEKIGYKIETFGKDTFVVRGVPADVSTNNDAQAIELLLEQFKHFSSHMKFGKREKLLRCVARQQSRKAGKKLSKEEMKTIAEDLFKCAIPNISPSGDKPTFVLYTENILAKLFSKQL